MFFHFFFIIVLYLVFYANIKNAYTLRVRLSKEILFLKSCMTLKKRKIKNISPLQSKHYNFNLIEKKWQLIWNSKKLLDKDFEIFNKLKNKKKDKSNEDIEENNKISLKKKYRMFKKYYILDMFPYPSSQGLHVGHILCFTITDVISKFKRMNNFCVFHPIGWDSFGLPCDRLSMKLKVNPKKIIKKNILNFKKQLIMLGFLFNWKNEINTCDKNYFKWTQWIIIQMYLNKLGYKKRSYVNWSKELNCVISNDELKNELNLQNLQIEKVKLLQWFLKITKYANRLIKDLKLINWPNKIKNMQINWIGKKSGIVIKAKIININKMFLNYSLDYRRKFIYIYYSNIYNHLIFLLFNCIYYIGIKKSFNKTNYKFFSSFLKSMNDEHEKNCGIIEENEIGKNEKKFVGPLINKNVNCNEKDMYYDDYISLNIDNINNIGNINNFMNDVLISNNIYSLQKKHCYLHNFKEGNKISNEEDTYVKIFLNKNEGLLENNKIIVSVNHPNINRIVNNDQFLLKYISEEIIKNDTSRLKNDKLYFSGSVIYNPLINKFIPIYVCSYILDNNKSILLLRKENKEDNKINVLIYELLLNSHYSIKKSIYNLKDWLFSRQRYWGEPFPFLYKIEKKKEEYKNNETDSVIYKKNEVNDKDTPNDIFLPIREENDNKKIEIKKIKNSLKNKVYIDKIPLCLPKFNKKIYEKDNKENKVYSVLSRFKEWIITKKKDTLYKRESDIMPQWAGSSWYYLRYIDPKNKEKIFDKKKVNFWLPVDLYVGGSEHAVLHLLYSRFFHKFLYDLKLVKHKEPFQKLFNQGILLNTTSFYFYTNLKNELVSYSEIYEKDIIKKEKGKRDIIIENEYKNGNSSKDNQTNEKEMINYNVNNDLLKKELKIEDTMEKEQNITNINEKKNIHNCINQELTQKGKSETEKIIESNNYIMENNYKKFLIDEMHVIEKNQKYYLKNLPSIEVQPNFEKMSKSKGNTINPNDIIKIYGSDCLRLHILFLGPVDQNKKWNIKGIKGTFKFLNNLYNLFIDNVNKKKKKKNEYTNEIDGNKNEKNIYTKKLLNDDTCKIKEMKNILNDINNKNNENINSNEINNDKTENLKNDLNDDIICEICKNKNKNKNLIINFEKNINLEKKKNYKKILKRNLNILKSKSDSFKKLSNKIKKNIEIETEKKKKVNYYIEKITNCINSIKLNTAVSFFMKFYNEIKEWNYIPLKVFLIFIKLLYPFCPHICEEFWFYYLKKYRKKKKKKICYFCNSSLLYYEKWPSLFQIKEEKIVKISIKINNKHIAFIQINLKNSKNIIKESTNLIQDRIQNEIKKGKKIINIINIPNKIINFIIK
ncbi:leucine--tRNA ligase, putative [Plasmodium gallinaceum]|uniref:leucine--tRNA ligase n=1 Tax=Plasmodium gallinaceum TaxID=5849 RepID=A0A1J1GME9_PLAGA|nr:leucine--tRNA ligase, putative [Plasmodium gallinaceum]CRG93507.1 leucine--tRNA ligase, putative [Plasmodium gallinaceum]